MTSINKHQQEYDIIQSRFSSSTSQHECEDNFHECRQRPKRKSTLRKVLGALRDLCGRPRNKSLRGIQMSAPYAVQHIRVVAFKNDSDDFMPDSASQSSVATDVERRLADVSTSDKPATGHERKDSGVSFGVTEVQADKRISLDSAHVKMRDGESLAYTYSHNKELVLSTSPGTVTTGSEDDDDFGNASSLSRCSSTSSMSTLDTMSLNSVEISIQEAKAIPLQRGVRHSWYPLRRY